LKAKILQSNNQPISSKHYSNCY